MKLHNLLIILLCSFFQNSHGSSQEPSQEAASEIDSNEIKPINERKVLQPPSPPYNKHDIQKIELDLQNEYDKNELHSNIERRMDMAMLALDEQENEPYFRRSMVNEWGLRRAFRNEQRKSENKNKIMDQKHETLALRNADKFGELIQYAKSVDGKVDTLHADHEATRKLAKATRGGVSAMKLAVNKHKADTEERLKRYSGELKENGARLATIQEAVNGTHQQTEANMETIVKQLGKNTIQESEVRDKIGKVLEQHGKHLDKTRNKLNKMKTRTKHLYESVEVQGGALDKLGTNYGNANDEIKALKEAIVGHSAALKKLELRDKETVTKMENQQMLTKGVLEINKQLLQLVADFAHKLDAKVVDAIENVSVQLAKVESIGEQQHANQEQTNGDKHENESGGEQHRNAVPSFVELVQHPLFLKKRDPRREQYEQEQSSATVVKPDEEKLGRPYAEEFNSSTSTTDENNITFASALKALGLKKNGNKLEAEGTSRMMNIM